MRYACPSTSFIAPSAPVKPKSTKLHDTELKGKGSARPVQRQARISGAKEAMKREVKKQKADILSKPKAHGITYVFVGNLLPSVNEERIRAHFRNCGEILRVSIRCSRGKPLNVDIPSIERTARDRHYASVEFASSRSARKALILHHTSLDGNKIVVASAAVDLPEVNELSNSTQSLKVNGRVNRPTTSTSTTIARPLAPHDTERFIDYRSPDSDRFRCFGFSFPKCII